jgi:hypothetical protein
LAAEPNRLSGCADMVRLLGSGLLMRSGFAAAM